MNQFLSSEHNKTKHGTSRGTSIKLIARETLQTLMSSSHKVIWKVEIPEFYFSLGCNFFGDFFPVLFWDFFPVF